MEEEQGEICGNCIGQRCDCTGALNGDCTCVPSCICAQCHTEDRASSAVM